MLLHPADGEVSAIAWQSRTKQILSTIEQLALPAKNTMKLTFAKLDARSIAPGLILITALLLLGAQPASSGDRSIDELQRARDILVRKEQRLQSVHDQTKTSINNLKDQLNSLYQLLDAVDTRLEQTHNSIGEIDKALRSN